MATICFVNTHDIIGGAERCSFDLMTRLRQDGHRVSLVVGRKLSDDPDVVQCSYPQWDWRPRAFLNYRLGLTETTLATPLRMVLRHPSFRKADVINIHNMHGCYWNIWTLPLLARRKPVVLTLHDEWLLTGDCAYTYDCSRWQTGCGNCPQIEWPVRPALGGRDFTAGNIRLKHLAARMAPRNNVVVVTPSEWLTARARQAPHLARFEISTIPNGVDTDVFRPLPKGPSRARFSLPQDRFCFLFFAGNLWDPRKGAPLLKRMLAEHGLPPQSMLILAGDGGEQLAAEFPEMPCRALGYLKSREDVAACLSAADCLLILSEADNLPYAAIEAAACGCPVLARDVGGVRETLRENRPDLLLPADVTPQRLAHELQRIAGFSESQKHELGQEARTHACRRFGMDKFVRAYEALFDRVSKRPGRSEPFDAAEFESEIVRYALDAKNTERFSELLKIILPHYAQWVWGQDSAYRRHFNGWQQSGFNLAPNHYYSPIPDVATLPRDLFTRRSELAGIDMREEAQLAFLDLCREYSSEYTQFPAARTSVPHQFHFGNGAFESIDAEVLHCVIRHFRPRRVVEIGSGYSTLVTAAACDANKRDGGPDCEFEAIEPYPNDLFSSPVPGLKRLLRTPLQAVPLKTLTSLAANDVLFIDSSHILKIGSDVQYEYLDLLPRLQPGVLVHIHDIFFPSEYPEHWVREEHVFWNEQYLLQAFLAFNDAFEIVFCGSYMHHRHPSRLAECFPAYDPELHLPGSFWMRRKGQGA